MPQGRWRDPPDGPGWQGWGYATDVVVGDAGQRAQVSSGARDAVQPEVARTVLEQVRSLLDEVGAEPSEPVTLESDLRALALDSLGAVELVARLEDQFGVDLPDGLLETAVTPGDWVQAIGAAGGAADGGAVPVGAPGGLEPSRPNPSVTGDGARENVPAHRAPPGMRELCHAATVWGLAASVALPAWVALQFPLSIRARWRLARRAAAALRRGAGITLSVEGDVPSARTSGRSGAVVVANHQSVVDGVAMLLAMEAPVAFVASTDLERQRLVGSLLRRLGCVFVDRDHARSAGSAVQQMAAVIRSGRLLMVFPEGGIEPPGQLGHFHLGAFSAAVAASAPVVPVGISGTSSVWKARTRMPHRGSVTVRIGTPIAAQGNGFTGAVELRDAAREAIAELTG